MIATLLQAISHDTTWRARCPAHQGENPTALSIALGHDRSGNPMTLLHCHAHQCPIEDICAALDIRVADLFAVVPRSMPALPPRSTSRTTRLRTMQHPGSQDDIAQIMLEEMIVSDPVFLQECPPARETFWRLAQEPARKQALFRALREGKHDRNLVWKQLQHEFGAVSS